jgi:molecular chaperone GrpE (heat shock protein)
MLIRNNKLFNIQRQYQQILECIEASDGEITQEIDAALQLSQQQMQEAGVNFGLCFKSLEYSEDILTQEIERLTSYREKVRKGKELLKNRLSQAMQQFGIERISSPTVNLSFRKSEAIEITEESAVPAAYLDQPPPKVSKTRIKEAIQQGIDVPGAELVKRQNLIIK